MHTKAALNNHTHLLTCSGESVKNCGCFHLWSHLHASLCGGVKCCCYYALGQKVAQVCWNCRLKHAGTPALTWPVLHLSGTHWWYICNITISLSLILTIWNGRCSFILCKQLSVDPRENSCYLKEIFVKCSKTILEHILFKSWMRACLSLQDALLFLPCWVNTCMELKSTEKQNTWYFCLIMPVWLSRCLQK